MPKKKTGRPVSVGKKIKKARTEQKMPFDFLANETGCSIDYLKKIESGKITPPVGTLLQIARALKIDSGALLKQDEETVKTRIKAYQKRTENYAYSTLTPGAENKHLKAFKISIEARQQHEGVGYRHEGEEFVYVLSGNVDVAVGDHLNRLKPGDSLHFNSGIKHHFKNTGQKNAELLVVVYCP